MNYYSLTLVHTTCCGFNIYTPAVNFHVHIMHSGLRAQLLCYYLLFLFLINLT